MAKKKVKVVTGLTITKLAGSNTALLATWSWKSTNTDHFDVVWSYENSKGVWVTGAEGTASTKKVGGKFQSDWSVPTSVTTLRVKVEVKPISTTYKSGKKTKHRWTSSWVSATENVKASTPPSAPPSPTCTLNTSGTTVVGTVATLTWDYSDAQGTSVEVWRSTDWAAMAKLGNVSHGTATHMSYADGTIGRGHHYRYYLRAYNATTKVYSEYSEATAVITPPQRPTDLKAALDATDSNGGRVKLTWADHGAQIGSAVVEYSTFNAWEDNSDDYQSMEVDTSGTHATVSGLETGRTWYFRMRRRNAAGHSYYAYLPGSSDTSNPKYYTATVALAGASKTYLPDRPTELTATDVTPEAADENAGQALLTWEGPFGGGDSYEAQWTDVLANFENNAMGDIKSVTVDFDDTGGECRLAATSLTRGRTWWFRLRRKTDAGITRWATTATGDSRETEEVARATIGAAPGQAEGEGLTSPTCVTTSTAYMVSDVVALSWTHNSESSTPQTAWEAELSVTDPDGVPRRVVLSGTTETAYALALSGADVTAGDGTEVSWRVRTRGVDPSLWSPWSRTQTFSCWAAPVAAATLSPLADGMATSLPLTVGAQASSGASANAVVAWWAEITAGEAYNSIGDDGTDIVVGEGEVIWRRETSSLDAGFDPNGLSLELAARDAPLQSGVAYELRVGCVTAQGMRAESSLAFSCAWELGPVPEPEAAMAFDEGTLCAWVYPSCRAYTGDEEQDEEGALVEGVTLSVFRLDDDGTTTELATGLQNTGDYGVIDPHPAAGEQWYRIVATDPSTGAQNMVDQSISCDIDRIVIQWDESWERVAEDDEAMAYRARTLELPYGVRHDEDYALDAALHEFIGRRWPVSRYGTQRGQTASLSAEVSKYDAETLSMLRQLSAWRGDCYVREPSGTGYWANVRARFSGGHESSAVSVQLAIRRVEPPAGG